MGDSRLSIEPLDRFPLIRPGDDLAGIVVAAIRRQFGALEPGAIVAVAQKVVSKAQDRYLRLADVSPTARARELAQVTGKDSRFVQAVLDESAEVLRAVPGVLIVQHRLGFIMANAGIDQSNIEHGGDERVLLLPLDPDGFCRTLKTVIDAEFATGCAVVMTDSFGRPWRLGTTGVAIGCAGLTPLVDMIGKPDLFGRTLRATEIALADQVAAAATLMMGETDEGRPVVLLRGMTWPASDAGAAALNRPRRMDLFR